MSKIWNFARQMFDAYLKDDGFTKGAALAYYTTFSLAPIIIIIITTAGFVFGKEAIRGEVYDQLRELFGAEVAQTIQNIVKASYTSEESWWATLISIATLIFGATGAFNQLKLSLDSIWEIESKPKNGFLGFVVARLTSFAMVLALGFVLLVSLVVNALAVGLSNRVAEHMSVTSEVGMAVIGNLISIVMIAGIFALIFKYLADVKIRWREVIWGSLFTAILFSIGRLAIGYYIGNSSITSGFGAAGSLVAILVWTYYSSQIVFLGAEFIWTLGQISGHPVMPSANAVKVIKETRKVNDAEAYAYEQKRSLGGQTDFRFDEKEIDNSRDEDGGFRHIAYSKKLKD